jgi:hypothetical protein
MIPWVKVSTRYTYKNKPKEQLGMTGLSINIASNDAKPLRTMIKASVISLVDFYLESTTMTIDELNAELKAGIQALSTLELRETK